MNALKIAGEPLPDMPWEERPAGSKEVLWRYTQNPIIGRDALSTSNSIFNSAVVPFQKGRYNYAGVFRCDDTNRRMRLHVGFSADGLRWDIDEADFRLTGADPEIGEWVYGYDPRVAKIGDKYYVTWCNGYHGPTIGIAWTDDFETFLITTEQILTLWLGEYPQYTIIFVRLTLILSMYRGAPYPPCTL